MAARDPNAKLSHLDACLDDASQYQQSAGFDRYELLHQALPDIDLASIDLSVGMLGKELKAPLMVAPMTGGVDRGHAINRRLAAAAQKHGLAMALGSLRLAIEEPARADLFKVRDVAPDILLFANVGVGQLRKGWGAKECLHAVRLVDADHLLIHLNAIQEAVQGGDTDFAGALGRIVEVATALSREGITVGVREVGFGLASRSAQQLIDAGIHVLDCGGAGGTSWAKVEGLCSDDAKVKALAHTFGEWGTPTAESVRAVRELADDVHVIATGGLRSGLDIAKALALGADLCGMARPFLQAANAGDEALERFIDLTLTELRIAMFGIGARTIDQLKGTKHLVELE